MKRKVKYICMIGLTLCFIGGCAKKDAVDKINGDYAVNAQEEIKSEAKESITEEKPEQSNEVADVNQTKESQYDVGNYDMVESYRQEYEDKIKPNQAKYLEPLVSVPNEKIVIKSGNSYTIIKNENGKAVQYGCAFYNTEADYITGIQHAGVFARQILIQDDEAWYIEVLSDNQPEEQGRTFEKLWNEHKYDMFTETNAMVADLDSNFTMDGYEWINNPEAKELYLNLVENIDENVVVMRSIGAHKEGIAEVLDVYTFRALSPSMNLETMVTYHFYNDAEVYEREKDKPSMFGVAAAEANDAALYVVYKPRERAVGTDDRDSTIVSYMINDDYQVKWKE